jgi:PurA ssDNA and RNA-binding protein
MDSIIESRELQIERKIFAIDLRENGRGKFLRITEDSQGHRNVIIVPISGVDDFADAIDDVLSAEPAGQN